MKLVKALLGSVILSGVGTALPVIAAEEDSVNRLDEVSVIGTREAQALKEAALSIGIIRLDEIDWLKPSHPSEIMQHIPGVHVNVTGGEGHMTAIRQPITTKAVYLYLEDGIPTRSTGFFNHNALYEINVPQAERIEVLKGPGSALYGSDAIGAVINVETRPAPLKAEADIGVELGQFGWRRLLFTGGNTMGDDGYRASVNLTHTDGWRDATNYDRSSAEVRWDRFLQSGATLKTVLSTSKIDQQTAGSSRLLADDYYNNPTLNYTPISYRKVNAFRLSTAYEKESSDSLLSITPYLRANSMAMLPNWSLSYDPVVYENGHDSLGVLFKYRQDYALMKTRLVTGVDIDYSPGKRYEQSITATRTGNIYTSYTIGSTIYDYTAIYSAISPYAHVEFSPSDKWRVSTGLRYDIMAYQYDNHLTALSTGSHQRPADTTVSFSNLSPKLGATYQFNSSSSGFISYRHAFRAPSASQLFRSGKASNSTSLKPIKVASLEAGLRSQSEKSYYTLSFYYMAKRDDILTYKYPDNTRETMNAGRTVHKGIELGYGNRLTDRLSIDIAASYAKHIYEEWVPNSTTDYSGNEMESAPDLIANTRLGYSAAVLNGGKLELEWVKLGSYWMDAANSFKYSGHDVFNLRANYIYSRKMEIYARLMNIFDARYATNARYSSFGSKFEYAPGMPRTWYLGMNYRF